MSELKKLLIWFKEGFPYYKSTCLHCGNTGNNNPPPPPPPPTTTPSDPSSLDGTTTQTQTPTPQHTHTHNHMIGVVSPSESERGFNATLTEVYMCGVCGKVYRFPRSVALAKVMETRRGRCGEYSRLFFKAMEALGYATRYVVCVCVCVCVCVPW